MFITLFLFFCLLSCKELEESGAWIREKGSILAAQGYGKDLSSVLRLLQKHKTLAGELLAHRSLLQVCVHRCSPDIWHMEYFH